MFCVCYSRRFLFSENLQWHRLLFSNHGVFSISLSNAMEFLRHLLPIYLEQQLTGLQLSVLRIAFTVHIVLLLVYSYSLRGIFRTQSNIYCENRLPLLEVNYFRKKAPSSMFDWVLTTSLSLVRITLLSI